MNINEYKDKLRKLYPSAIISVEMEEKYVKWELKLYPKISEKEHEDSFTDIKNIFGDTLMERYTEETGKHFIIYQRYKSPSKLN